MKYLKYLSFLIILFVVSSSSNIIWNTNKTDKIEVLTELALVEGGTFIMGSDFDKKNEKPAHSVTVDSFYIGKYEVTNYEFAIFLNEKGNQKEGGYNWINLDGNYLGKTCPIHKNNTRFVVEHGYNNHPVTYVTWYGATAYCKWLSEMTGENYTLPSEAEWEFAAKGGNLSKGYRYAGSDDIESVAFYMDNSKDCQLTGTKKPNELDLYDMSGNVKEWCEDKWNPNYKGTPTDGSPRLKPKSLSSQVIRGGSWSDKAYSCRTTSRGVNMTYGSYNNVGFRIAKR